MKVLVLSSYKKEVECILSITFRSSTMSLTLSYIYWVSKRMDSVVIPFGIVLSIHLFNVILKHVGDVLSKGFNFIFLV